MKGIELPIFSGLSLPTISFQKRPVASYRYSIRERTDRLSLWFKVELDTYGSTVYKLNQQRSLYLFGDVSGLFFLVKNAMEHTTCPTFLTISLIKNQQI